MNVGITGHRLNKIDSGSVERVSGQFRHFADAVNVALESILAGAGNIFRDQPPLVRVVTGLAEGADRIAVSRAPPEWIYEVILPMAPDEYVKDFAAGSETSSVEQFNAMLAAAASVTELPSPETPSDHQDRNACYRRLGDFLTRQVDVLVAVWDGAPPDGPGGTGDVVARALASAKPVIWIDAGSQAEIKLLASTGASPALHETTPLGADALHALLRSMLLPRPAPAQHSSHDDEREPKSDVTSDAAKAANVSAPAFFNMLWPSRLYLPFSYMMLRRLAKAGRWSWPLRYPDFKDQLGSWTPFFSAMPSSSGATLQKSLETILFPRSIWADTLAWYFGNVYRSAYVSIFLLASLSVPLGLCYLFFLWSPTVLDIKAGFVVIELLIIATVIVVVRRGVRSDWHGLWLQTRELSELLRLGRPLAYVGALRDFVPAPAAGETGSFVSWYTRATFREVGLPNATLSSSYVKMVLLGTNATEIREQRSYHAANAKNLRRVHHLLHKSGDFCFTATIVFLLIYLAAWGIDWTIIVSHAHAAEEAAAHHEEAHSLFHEVLEYGIKPAVSIAAAGLPALGAALTGIREQGDFEGFADRSRATDEDLGVAEAAIDQLVRKEVVSVEEATDALKDAVLVMAKDVTAWKRQYLGKRLALPA